LDKRYRKLLKRYKLLNNEMKRLESEINKKIAIHSSKENVMILNKIRIDMILIIHRLVT